MTAPVVHSVEVHALRLPPASPWEDATNRVDALEFVIALVHCSDGTVGTGYTYSVDIGGSAIRALIEDYLAPLVIGRDARDVEGIWTMLDRQSRRLGRGVNRLAIAALDTALWDAAALHARVPVSQMWGQHRTELPVYRSEIRLDAADSVTGLRSRAEAYTGEGYRDVKIKVGAIDPARDLARIDAVRDVIDGELFVDANQRWSLDEAKRRLSGFADRDVAWIEEPLPFHDVAGHAELRRHSPVPIALGESLFAKEQFLEYLRAEAVDIVQADVAFVGGYTEWLRIAALADAFGKPIAPHYLMELSLPALCAAPNARFLENVVGGGLHELGLSDKPLAISDGVARLDSGAGTGIRFSRDALAAHALDPHSLRTSFRGGSK